MKGAAQLEAGPRDEAFASLWASLGLLEAAGNRLYLGVALETLAKAFMAAGDKTGATAARAELRRWETVSTWHSSDAGVAFRRRASAAVATPSADGAKTPVAGQGERPSEPTKPPRRRTRAGPRASS